MANNPNSSPAFQSGTNILAPVTAIQTSSANVVQPAIGIDVPDYLIRDSYTKIAKGKHTWLITQEYEYEDHLVNTNVEYREYLQLLKMSAAILPMCPRENKYLLIRQFRYPAWHNANINHSPTTMEDGWLYEIIAGVVEPGETPEETVVREAQEEGDITLAANDVRKIHHCFMTPGLTNEEMSLFLGIIDSIPSAIGKTGIDNEHIRAKWMTADEIRQLASKGLIRDAKTLIALYSARVL